MDNPSLQQWKALYQAALTFKKIEPWTWMWDSDVCGVQNPKTGEIGYCCVMGMLGEHYALAVYLGSEGLEGYLRMQAGEEFSPLESLYIQKCLSVSFEDRTFLEKEDITIIKELGITFRGCNFWPLFRNYEPGYVPWFLTRDDATFLTVALNQVTDVCLRLEEDAEVLIGPTEDHYLVRVFNEREDTWIDEWLIPQPFKKPEIVVEVDESRLKTIEKTLVTRKRIWEIDFFYSPEGVREKDERPYYPYIMLIADHHTELILDIHLAGPIGYASEFSEHVLTFLEKIKWVPKEIWVKREESFILLNPITSYLGITLKKMRELPALDDAQASMAEFLLE